VIAVGREYHGKGLKIDRPIPFHTGWISFFAWHRRLIPSALWLELVRRRKIHPVRLCSRFLQMTVNDRSAYDQEKQLCSNFFARNHQLRDKSSAHNCFHNQFRPIQRKFPEYMIFSRYPLRTIFSKCHNKHSRTSRKNPKVHPCFSYPWFLGFTYPAPTGHYFSLILVKNRRYFITGLLSATILCLFAYIANGFQGNVISFVCFINKQGRTL